MANAKGANKAQDKNFFAKIVDAVKRFCNWVGTSFKDMYHELKKVSWPTRKELINYSLVVLAFMVAMGIIIGLIDFGAGWLVNRLIG